MGETLHVVIAECPACGERRFRAPREAPQARDVLSCAGCSLRLTYGFLAARAPKPTFTPKPKRKAPARTRKRAAS
jgi:hypothetical protein